MSLGLPMPCIRGHMSDWRVDTAFVFRVKFLSSSGFPTWPSIRAPAQPVQRHQPDRATIALACYGTPTPSARSHGRNLLPHHCMRRKRPGTSYSPHAYAQDTCMVLLFPVVLPREAPAPTCPGNGPDGYFSHASNSWTGEKVAAHLNR